jgi:hypothetical protein
LNHPLLGAAPVRKLEYVNRPANRNTQYPKAFSLGKAMSLVPITSGTK